MKQMTKLFDFKQVLQIFPNFLLKLPVTLELAFLAMIIGLVLGLILRKSLKSSRYRY